MDTLRNASIGKLYTRLQDLQRQKVDVIVPSDTIRMSGGMVQVQAEPRVMIGEDADIDLNQMERLREFSYRNLSLTDTAKNQASEKLRIPRTFYRYLESDHIDLLDYNFNQLMEASDRNYFIRSMINGNAKCRALLSDQFKVIDNLDVLSVTLDTIKELGAPVQIGRCNLSEDQMYIEVISKEVMEQSDELVGRYRSPRKDGNSGDNSIMAGFIISNSETGRGLYKVQPRAIVSKCTNGLVFKKDALASTHLGSKMESGVLWQQDTLEAEISLIKKQTRDAVQTFLSKDYLGKKIRELTGYTTKLNEPIQAVRNVSRQLSMPEKEMDKLLMYFMQGDDMTPIGVMNSITYYAQGVESSEQQFELEERAMDLLPQIESMQYN